MTIDVQVLIWDSRLSGVRPQIGLQAHLNLSICQVQASADGHVMIGGSQNGQVGIVLSHKTL